MSEAPSTGGRGGGGTPGQASLSVPPGERPAYGGSAAATTEELLDAVEKEIAESYRARDRVEGRQESSSCAPPSPSRFWKGAREAAKRVLGIAKNSSSSPAARSAARIQHEEKASSDVAGTTKPAPEVPTRTGSEDEARSEQQPVALTRSEYGAMMRSALAKIQEGVATGDDGEAAFAEMERAMTGLMDLTYGKVVEPPKLPYEFATKWPHADADPLHGTITDYPVILASGYSVGQLYQQWFSPQKNSCPVTNQSLPHSLTVPNHLLHDMIAAWCLDHSILSQSTTVDTLSIPLAPSEEQIQDILEKFSGNSALQQEALHLIQLLSKASKGVQPCLDKWPDLIPVLIDLKKKWKSTWTRDLEEERLTVILKLSMHRPNREILAGQNKLPGVLKQVIEKADRLGSSASSLAKVASIVATLSEFEMFRKRMLDIGGMKMLQDLLKIEDVVVRKEAGTAILALCTDDEGKSSAVVYDVPDTLLECFMVTDEFLLLLDCLPKAPHVLDKICDKAVELVNIVMAEHAGGLVTSQTIHSAISLIYIIVQRDVSKMKVENVEDFKERLRELSSNRIPMKTLFQVENIIKTLSEMFPAPTRRVQN